MAKKIEIKGPIVTNTAGWLYDLLGWDAAYPKALQESLQEAGEEDVILEVNSNGGVCTAGFEMYKIIKDYPGKVTVHLINAMSAASLIVCAADEALASDAAILMIHNTQSYAEGDYRDMQMSADALKEFNQSIINVYARKTGRSREELQEMMDHDTYMSPDKAKEYGFIEGYLYGDPADDKTREKKTEANAVGNAGIMVVNATVPVITDQKALEIYSLFAQKDGLAEMMKKVSAEIKQAKGEPEQAKESTGESLGFETDSNKKNSNQKNEGGTENMTLEEFLQENPEAKAEMEQKIQNAKDEAVTAERDRLKNLDELAHTVTPEALADAKYGKNPSDAKTLAFNAMKDEKLRMTAYMDDALEDSKNSGVDNVGAGSEEDPEDEADVLASHANKRRGGKRKWNS